MKVDDISAAELRDIVVRESGVIASWNNFGSISGSGELAFVAGDLRAPLTFAGQVFIVSDGASVVEVNHPLALGATDPPVIVAGGDLYLKTTVANTVLIDSGRVRLDMPGFDGEIALRGGALVSDRQTVELNSTIRTSGPESTLDALSPSQLVINRSVTGEGSLRLGGSIIVNDVIAIDGDLRVTARELNSMSHQALVGRSCWIAVPVALRVVASSFIRMPPCPS